MGIKVVEHQLKTAFGKIRAADNSCVFLLFHVENYRASSRSAAVDSTQLIAARIRRQDLQPAPARSVGLLVSRIGSHVTSLLKSSEPQDDNSRPKPT